MEASGVGEGHEAPRSPSQERRDHQVEHSREEFQLDHRQDMAELTQAITRAINASQTAGAAGSTGHMDRIVHRLATKKELPSFSGDALEWPCFKRAFEQSTEKGDYTNEENIARLCASLRGEAKEAVAALMIANSGVDKIMDVLQL